MMFGKKKGIVLCSLHHSTKSSNRHFKYKNPGKSPPTSHHIHREPETLCISIKYSNIHSTLGARNTSFQNQNRSDKCTWNQSYNLWTCLSQTSCQGRPFTIIDKNTLNTTLWKDPLLVYPSYFMYPLQYFCCCGGGGCYLHFIYVTKQ